jgi:NADPH:quinone reductase-like Zn-dependent oxidoreductase
MFGYQSYDYGPASVHNQPDVEGADVSRTARAYWLSEPGSGEIRQISLPDPGPGEVRVRTLVSGVSRGTEALVFRGGVPESQYDVMRAPFQEGELPGPVKYGYLNVGVVEAGSPDLLGHTVFCLYPHQTAYVVPAEAVTPVPTGVPPRRAVLAGTLETAVNALWDARPLVGDRVAVVGAGMVGCCVARLLARIPRRPTSCRPAPRAVAGHQWAPAWRRPWSTPRTAPRWPPPWESASRLPTTPPTTSTS